MISRGSLCALAARPRVLCDEPTSALSLSGQAEIVNLLLQLQDLANQSAQVCRSELRGIEGEHTAVR